MNPYFFITPEGNSTQGNFQAADFKAVSEGFSAQVASVCRAAPLENACSHAVPTWGCSDPEVSKTSAKRTAETSPQQPGSSRPFF